MNLQNPYVFVGIIIFTILYYTIFKKSQWLLTLIVSYALYYYLEKYSVVYIVITTISVYLLGAKIESVIEAEGKKQGKIKSKKYLILGLLINFGILFGLKYLGLLNLFGDFTFDFKSIVAPLGISFYTFKAVSYLVDIYRSKYKAQKNFLKFASFVAYFPAFLQGPIDKYEDLSKTLYTEKDFSWQNLSRGLYLIIFGLMKKTVVADRLVEPVSNVVSNYTSYQGSVLFLAMFVFGIQIYADFSGGIDIVRGFSKIWGIELSENFNSPYLADSVAEYWRRWHMTLGAFMREYVFYPMSLSKTFTKINRKSRKKFGAKYGKIFTLLISTLVVYILIGAWHGARVISLLFGLYYGVVISLSLILEGVRGSLDEKIKISEKIKYVFKIIWVSLITTVGRYFSKADTAKELWQMIKYTAGNFFGENFLKNFYTAMAMTKVGYLVVGAGVLVMIFAAYYKEREGDFFQKLERLKPITLYLLLVIVLGLTLVFGIIGGDITKMEFVYQKY